MTHIAGAERNESDHQERHDSTNNSNSVSLRDANIVAPFSLGLVTFARMDAFLRLAKGLSPANANRDAEKVLHTAKTDLHLRHAILSDALLL